MADRILIFHRGIGTAKLKGLLISEKIDLLCEYTVIRALDYLKSLIPKWGAKKRPPVTRTSTMLSPGDTGGDVRGRMSEFMRQFSTVGGKFAGEKYIASDHKYAKVIRLNVIRGGGEQGG